MHKRVYLKVVNKTLRLDQDARIIFSQVKNSILKCKVEPSRPLIEKIYKRPISRKNFKIFKISF